MTDRLLGVHEATAREVLGRQPDPLVHASWNREFVSGAGGGPLPESTSAEQLITLALARIGRAGPGGGTVLSIKVPMAAVARGAWDARLTALGGVLGRYRVVVLLHHEPEDDLRPDVFVPGHNRGREMLRRGGPTLEVGYAAMAYQWRPGSRTTADAQVWARDVEADWYLCDVYSGKSFAAGLILPEHPGWVRWHTEMIAAHPGRRWGIAERGIIAGAARADTIRREARWLATDPIGQTCGMYLYWSSAGTEGESRWILDSAGLAAISDLLDWLSTPVGYRPGPMPGVLISERTGCLVDAGMLDAHELAHSPPARHTDPPPRRAPGGRFCVRA